MCVPAAKGGGGVGEEARRASDEELIAWLGSVIGEGKRRRRFYMVNYIDDIP